MTSHGAQTPGADVRALPYYDKEKMRVSGDWIVAPIDAKTGVYRTANHHEIVLSNGLITRTFRLVPGAATVGFDNLMTGEALLRGVKPEARITVNGAELNVGGLVGQENYAYLTPEWIEALTRDPNALQYAGHEVSDTGAPFTWKRVRYCQDLPWPPLGKRLTLGFAAQPGGGQMPIVVDVHYEMYDGIPLLAKWLTIRNGCDSEVTLDSYTGEILAAVEMASLVSGQPTHFSTPNVQVVTDYMFGGDSLDVAGKAVHWVNDPDYKTQVNFALQAKVLLESRPVIGPAVALKPGESFTTHRTYELVFDSTERERNSLATRRMFRTIAPWTTENPILMHVRSADPDAVRLGIDQCAELGFEMIILTFGSGFNIENEDPAYLAQLKELADYAHAKGIEIGGYSLLASRTVGTETDVINPETGKPGGFATFGNSPCLCSAWGQDYFRKLYVFYEMTGFDLLEHDGSYPGDVCASSSHPGHRSVNDSQYRQWRAITHFYNWCRGRGIYLSVPDLYYLNGSNKSGMGYRETNWSLPRAEQVIHARQNIYDGTWEKTPSMGWMFVPLTEYHGGGAAATLEPLAEHLNVYEAHLANLFGTGVQACFRGPRLYDTDDTKAVVKQWVDFYKTHRAILDSDIIHVRRADGRNIDCMMSVNPRLEERALAMVFNPLQETVKRTLRLPLYYAGLTDTATVREREGNPMPYQLDRDYSITLEIEMTPQSATWFVIAE